MKGTLLIFKVLNNTSKYTMNKFCREFYGYTVPSNHGKYTYTKKGFIENFPYIKPVRCVIIVRPSDAPKIIEFLKKYNAEIRKWSVELNKEDSKVLYGNNQSKTPR